MVSYIIYKYQIPDFAVGFFPSEVMPSVACFLYRIHRRGCQKFAKEKEREGAGEGQRGMASRFGICTVTKNLVGTGSYGTSNFNCFSFERYFFYDGKKHLSYLGVFSPRKSFGGQILSLGIPTNFFRDVLRKPTKFLRREIC